MHHSPLKINLPSLCSFVILFLFLSCERQKSPGKYEDELVTPVPLDVTILLRVALVLKLMNEDVSI